MSTTVERPQTIPDLSEEEMDRLRTVRDRQTTQPPLTVLDALTVERFRAWLESKAENAEVGMPRAANMCPIYGYLSETFRKRYCGFSVAMACTYHPYRKPGDNRMAKLPGWARMFVHGVDSTPHGHPITARRALEVLDKVVDNCR